MAVNKTIKILAFVMLDITCHPMPILATREACVSLLPQELPG